MDEIVKLSPDSSYDKKQKSALKMKAQLAEVKELDSQYKYFLKDYNNNLEFYYN